MCIRFPIFLFLLLIFFSIPALSAEPIVCPTATSIKKTPFSEAQKGEHPGVWTFLQYNQQYNTSLHWNFSLMLEADSRDEADRKAKKMMRNLKLSSKPSKTGNVWVCDYQAKGSLTAIAYSRP